MLATRNLASSRHAAFLFILFLLVSNSLPVATAVTFSQIVGWDDPFLNNPFYVSNATAYQDLFSPYVRYWGPTAPNVEGAVTLKFDVPFAIDSASFTGGISAYTVGSDANFDSNASTYLDVSTDNQTWTTIASQTNQNATGSGIGGTWDISSYVSGASVVYIRSRLFTTTTYPWGMASQFMRQGAPYLPGNFTASSATPDWCSVVDLEFDAPVASTSGVIDVNGLSTGFTHWLPGTGGAIPRNDPNLNLLSAPGYLSFTSQRADINQANGFGRNLSSLDSPGVQLTDMVGKDFRVVAKFDDIEVTGLSDQLLLYVGTSSEKVLRGGFHEMGSNSTGQYVLAGNTGAGDFGIPTIDQLGVFSIGDDIVLSLSRIAGVWSLSWENLTNPAASGDYSGFTVPWLDSESDLYLGLMHMDARNFTSQMAKIDYFRVEVVCPVPEPSSIGLIMLACIACGAGFKTRG